MHNNSRRNPRTDPCTLRVKLSECTETLAYLRECTKSRQFSGNCQKARSNVASNIGMFTCQLLHHPPLNWGSVHAPHLSQKKETPDNEWNHGGDGYNRLNNITKVASAFCFASGLIVQYKICHLATKDGIERVGSLWVLCSYPCWLSNLGTSSRTLPHL